MTNEEQTAPRASDIAWYLRSITRIDEGLHEFVFDVDGQPTVKLTVKGSFSLEGCRVEGVVPAA